MRSSIAPSAAARVELHLSAVERFDVPAAFSVTGGTLVSVLVSGPGSGDVLPGHLDSAAAGWTSDTPPTPGVRYQVTAAANTDGTVATVHASFTVTTPAAAASAQYWVTPATGTTVGVNAPLVIRFTKDVADRAAVERALTVASTTPVVGAWHWINAREVHFRPQNPWPAHSRFGAALRSHLRARSAADGLIALGFGGAVVLSAATATATATAAAAGLIFALADPPMILSPSAAQAIGVLGNDDCFPFLLGIGVFLLGNGLAIL